MARNRRRHGEEALPLKVAIQWAHDTAFDLWQMLHPVRTSRAQASSSEVWERPEPDWTKCNTDAAFFDRDRSAASGVILRDHFGRACGGRAKWYEHCLNALAAEAMACCDGVRFARERGVRRLHLETDCQILVQLWEKRADQKSEIDPFLRQLEDLSGSFKGFKFCFINRKCNKLAHECARLVSRNSQVEEWLITPPRLRDIADFDCNPAHV